MISLLLPASLLVMASLAVDLDTANENSIKNAASTIAYGLMKYYTGNVTNTISTIAVLPPPYYWWESGAMWGAMVDYYHYTNDNSYTEVIGQALSSQAGPKNDLMVPLHVKDEGNDDQAFWGFATMSAAEKSFPNPLPSLSWIDLTQNMWNTQVRRWDESSCGGGLRWQIFESNHGYDYKNTVSNAAFFQISARLARFTGNQTYAEWADKSYDWMVQKGLIDVNYKVFDGIGTESCDIVNEMVWTYNTAITIYGAAVMYNYTGASHVWKEKVQGLLDATANFFGPPQSTPGVMFEPICELTSSCNNDQLSFKAYLSRFLWATTLMAPFTTEKITSLLSTSARAAARSCSGGSDGVTCGEKWYISSYDGNYGVGQQMAALETIQGLLAGRSPPPLRASHSNMPVEICHNRTDSQCSTVASTSPETDVVTSSSNPVAEKTPAPDHTTRHVSKLQSLGLNKATPVDIKSSLILSPEDRSVPRSAGIAKPSKVTNLSKPSPLLNAATILTCHRSNQLLATLTIALLLF